MTQTFATKTISISKNPAYGVRPEQISSLILQFMAKVQTELKEPNLKLVTEYSHLNHNFKQHFWCKYAH